MVWGFLTFDLTKVETLVSVTAQDQSKFSFKMRNKASGSERNTRYLI